MARHSNISSLEDLHNWFHHLGRTNWNLYRGHQEHKKHGSIITKQGDDTMGLEESWNLLRSMIEMNSASGGQFTVYVPEKANGNQGASVFVSINMAQHARGRTALSGTPHASMGMVPVERIAEEVEKERKIWDLERRLEDMEAAQEAGLGINDIVKEQLRTIDFGPILAGLVSHFTKQPLGVQLQGTPADMQEPPMPEEAPEGYAYDGRRLKPVLDMIRPHFTDDESFYGFLNTVGTLFATNPEEFKKNFGYA